MYVTGSSKTQKPCFLTVPHKKKKNFSAKPFQRISNWDENVLKIGDSCSER